MESHSSRPREMAPVTEDPVRFSSREREGRSRVTSLPIMKVVTVSTSAQVFRKLPVRSQSKRRIVFIPSIQMASEPLAVRSASFTVMSAVE